MSDRRFSDFGDRDPDIETAEEVRRTDWIVGLLSALVLAIVLYAAMFGLGRDDHTASLQSTEASFSLAQLGSFGAPVSKPQQAPFQGR